MVLSIRHGLAKIPLADFGGTEMRGVMELRGITSRQSIVLLLAVLAGLVYSHLLCRMLPAYLMPASHLPVSVP